LGHTSTALREEKWHRRFYAHFGRPTACDEDVVTIHALKRAARSSLVFALASAVLSGCAARATVAPTIAPRPVSTLFPTLAQTEPPAPSSAPAADDEWVAGAHGIELRHMRLARKPGQAATPLLVARIDPAQVRLRVAYEPQRPRSIRRWFSDEQSLLAVNGGFFTEQYRSTALVISDGVASGTSYAGFGGMLAVAPDGGVALRALRDQPYDSDEPLAQAMQSFPMLVFPGGAPADFQDNGGRARRTALALDRAGHLLVIVCPSSALTLRELADWLLQSDLDIDRALNLDGGPSTGMILADGSADAQIDSLGPLPLVLLAQPKE
jgi:uncharacterized protein YigE (DUF2233 family)